MNKKTKKTKKTDKLTSTQELLLEYKLMEFNQAINRQYLPRIIIRKRKNIFKLIINKVDSIIIIIFEYIYNMLLIYFM